MKLLCVHPGAPFSIGDVYTGMMAALRRRGEHDIQEYHLETRIEEAHRYLGWQAKERRKKDRNLPKAPHMPDVIRMASMTLLEAILTVNPHHLVLFSGMLLHPDTMILIYRLGIPTTLLLMESPYDDEKQARITPLIQNVFTNERASVALFERWYRQYEGKRGHANPQYMPHAFDPNLHTPEPDDAQRKLMAEVPKHDVVFVGSGFIERQEMLEAIDWEGLDIDLGLYGHWAYLSRRSRLRKYLHEGIVKNEVTTALYRNAKVGLNLYRTSIGSSKNAMRISGAQSLNPRALELAATGTPHVSDHRAEVEEVFGSTVPTFNDPQSLAEQLQALLGDDARRDMMKRTLPGLVTGWTFDERAALLSDVVAGRTVLS